MQTQGVVALLASSSAWETLWPQLISAVVSVVTGAGLAYWITIRSTLRTAREVHEITATADEKRRADAESRSADERRRRTDVWWRVCEHVDPVAAAYRDHVTSAKLLHGDSQTTQPLVDELRRAESELRAIEGDHGLIELTPLTRLLSKAFARLEGLLPDEGEAPSPSSVLLWLQQPVEIIHRIAHAHADRPHRVHLDPNDVDDLVRSVANARSRYFGA